MRSFFLDSAGRVRFTLQRSAFQWCALLIVVYQGGKGKCAKVGPGEGVVAHGGSSEVADNASSDARAARQKQAAEEQHPDSMTARLPAALVDDLNAQLSSSFYFVSGEVDFDSEVLEQFSAYKHLFVAVLLVSLKR